jgi:hypothetical protein
MRARNTLVVSRGLPLLLVTVAVCAVTLAPLRGAPHPPSACLACGDRPLAGIVLNVLLFVPLGAAAALRWRGARALLAGPALSLLVELAQTVIPGRQAALVDLLANSAGAALGVAIVHSAALLRRPGVTTAALLALAAALIPVLATLGTGRLLSPAPPAAAALPYAGRAAEGRWTGVEDFAGRERLALGRRGDDVWLRYRTVAADAGLDAPELVWRGMAAGVGRGMRVRAWAGRDGGRWCVRLEDRLRCGGPTAGRGWAVLAYPASLARRFGRIADAGWMALLFLPLGCALRRRAVPLLAAAAAFAGMVALPPLIGLSPSPPGEWMGAVAGLAAGIVIAGWIRASGAAGGGSRTTHSRSAKGFASHGVNGSTEPTLPAYASVCDPELQLPQVPPPGG